MYCTPAKLADAKLTRELAEVATPDRERIVEDELFEVVLREQDTSGFNPSEVAVAIAALGVVEQALIDAGSVIDGYLAMRKPKPYPLPLNPVPGIVSVWARWIARYLLHKDRVNTREQTDPVVRDYERAIKYLEQVRDGEFSLGSEDPLAPPSSGDVVACSPDRQFTMDSLRDFGQ